MRIIAVMSPKGGIGKTTTSDSIAYMLGEEQGKRVLVLDGDPQGDTSKTFGVFEPDGIGMSELLEKHECVGGTYKTGDLIRPTEYSHVDIIPANGYLMKTDMNLLLKSEDNQATRLREALEEVADAYDYCICILPDYGIYRRRSFRCCRYYRCIYRRINYFQRTEIYLSGV